MASFDIDWDDFDDIKTILQNPEMMVFKVKKRENAQVINNKYIIGDFLGEGVSAKVYEALDMVTLQRRALKIFEFRRIFKTANADEREEMIYNELKLLRKLDHPNLMKYVDIFTNKVECKSKRDLKVWAFMDHCICSIDDLIESYAHHRIPLRKCHKYFCELIEAVDYLHSNSIGHKDIKTGNIHLSIYFTYLIHLIANILITVADHVKLTDLGVCEKMNTYNRKCVCYKTAGSFLYQPPELFDLENNEYAAFPIDVWACGVTLYFMATGSHPFQGPLLDLISKIPIKEVVYPPNLINNIQLINLLEKIFKKNPIERITIDEIKRHAWLRSLPGKVDNKYNLKLNSHEEEFSVLLKPRTKYDDFYRSMSMTPYIHQMYYPIDDNLNVIQLHEKEIDEFENLKKIPIIRSNRRKSFNDTSQLVELTSKILELSGTNLERKTLTPNSSGDVERSLPSKLDAKFETKPDTIRD